jgi:hypothetical protein
VAYGSRPRVQTRCQGRPGETPRAIRREDRLSPLELLPDSPPPSKVDGDGFVILIRENRLAARVENTAHRAIGEELLR